jgi:hypothetical protein
MHLSIIVAILHWITLTSAHGVVTSITGANGVEMPGLSSQLEFACGVHNEGSP